MIKAIFTALLILLLPVLAFAQSVNSELVIKGRVLDDQGRSVPGAFVSVNPVGPLKGILPMTTANERGEFLVTVHQTGDFFATAQKPSEGYPNTANPFYYPASLAIS